MLISIVSCIGMLPQFHQHSSAWVIDNSTSHLILGERQRDLDQIFRTHEHHNSTLVTSLDIICTAHGHHRMSCRNDEKEVEEEEEEEKEWEEEREEREEEAEEGHRVGWIIICSFFAFLSYNFFFKEGLLGIRKSIWPEPSIDISSQTVDSNKIMTLMYTCTHKRTRSHTHVHKHICIFMSIYIERERKKREGLGFFCLMAYQPSWVIWCQIYPFRRTAVMLFNP